MADRQTILDNEFITMWYYPDKKIIHHEDVLNKDALINPESLELYKDIPELSD